MEAKILVADDDRGTRLIEERILKSQGLDVISAGDGLEAWQLVRTQPPDIALCDWMMPGMDGVELCRRIKADPALKAIYVIIVTAKGQGEEKVVALEAGADEFLTKPVDPAELKARIKVGLRVVEYQRSLRATALTDELTGLFNRRAFHSELLRQSARSRRDGSPFSLLIIDVNRFKTINDRFGHDRGDQVLQQVARRIGEVLRRSDTLFRIGGDEFAVVLPEGPHKASRVVARFHEVFGQPDDSKPVDPEHPTISVGVATLQGAESVEELFHRADADMYKDKTQMHRVTHSAVLEGLTETRPTVLIVRGTAAEIGPLAERLRTEGYAVSLAQDYGGASLDGSEVPGIAAQPNGAPSRCSRFLQ
jgi:diguanylate cyclase (GGDEF)-like protein